MNKNLPKKEKEMGFLGYSIQWDQHKRTDSLLSKSFPSLRFVFIHFFVNKIWAESRLNKRLLTRSAMRSLHAIKLRKRQDDFVIAESENLSHVPVVEHQTLTNKVSVHPTAFIRKCNSA